MINAGLGKDESRRLLKAAYILEGLDFVKPAKDDLGGLLFTGPSNIFPQFCLQTFQTYEKRHSLKPLHIPLNRVKLHPKHYHPRPGPTFEDALKSLAIEIADEKKRRSVLNRNVVCKCGYKTAVKTDSIKSVAIKGNFVRSRCKKCEACTRPKCGQCKPCLNPKMKQACIQRTCQFPNVPKCPCFA